VRAQLRLGRFEYLGRILHHSFVTMIVSTGKRDDNQVWASMAV
jgi:hypothetical protein